MSRKQRVSIIDAACKQFPHLDRKDLTAYICCREIEASGERPANPRHLVDPDAELRIIRKQYISRGGLKLAYAIEQWGIDVAGLIMLDAGASTGGFTDCLLQKGASHVFAVDVGYNQLDYSLRTDPRVSVWERRNIMDVTPEELAVDAAVADLSFRSIRGAASRILSLTRRKWLIALIKPQFEVPRGHHFNGVITDEAVLEEVLLQVTQGLADEQVRLVSIAASPIQGRRGNQEYLALLKPMQ